MYNHTEMSMINTFFFCFTVFISDLICKQLPCKLVIITSWFCLWRCYTLNQTVFGGLVGARSRKLLLMLKAELPLCICWNQYATLPRWPEGDWNHNLKLTANLAQLHTNTERNKMCSISFGCETSCICNSPGI